MPALLAVHEADPRKELLKKVKAQVADMVLFGNAILVATYKRPKTARYKSLSLELPDQTTDEDKHQGKVGLVIKLGPLAFKDDEAVQFHGQKVDVGDWVVYRPADGWALTLAENQVDCRMLVEASIRMRIPAPDAVW